MLDSVPLKKKPKQFYGESFAMPSTAEKTCPSCGQTYNHTLSFCVKDGQPLVPVNQLIGQVLDERYRIDAIIGQGGMGVVYRATHIHIDTEYAVKVLNPELVSNQTAIERFRLEAKAAGRIRHPNAVQVTDFGITPEGVVYLVMELLAGSSLRKLLDETAPFRVERVREILLQICGAVEAAHHKGIIHRDLKPDNILVSQSNGQETIKVLDFGIAKLKEQAAFPALKAPLTQAGTLIGTPEYMSPEQCQGHALDPRADVYSIGVMLYEMLSGQLPFSGTGTIDIVFKHLYEPVRPLRELVPELPSAVEDVVLRALQKAPEQRQASAAQLSAEFRSATGAEPRAPRETVVATTGAPANSFADPAAPTIPETSQPAPPTLLNTPPARSFTTSLIEAGHITGENLPLAQPRPAPVRWRWLATALVLVLALGGVGAWFWPKPVSQPPLEPPPPGMVLIEGGKFVMGRNDGEEDERPAHEVEIKAFYLDKYEVTNQQYKALLDATGHAPPRHWNGREYPPEDATLPVTHVTWYDAQRYAQWAGKRLPTEAEWEYAARGGSRGQLYPWGNEWQEGLANLNRANRQKPAPVQSFERDRSPFGVFGLAGNVAEWVQDSFGYYGQPPSGAYKVYRGGSFADEPAESTATHRWYSHPNPAEDPRTARILPTLGFRCAKNAPQTP
jgi:eukaryotic-like serine/threonine-protein kinase